MKTLYRRCAGLDVHQATVVACLRLQERGRVRYELATFETTVAGLTRLADWLAAHGVTHAALEATGVYWKPVWHILEARCRLVLANAAAVKQVPGRKSDVNDATWLADLLAHGLVRGSFVPPAPIQALRDLTRTRKQLAREVAQHTLRIAKTLQDTNLKLSSVLSDVLGVSGRAILRALIAGESDPARLVAATTGKLHAPPEALRAALEGTVRPHHRFLLQLHLDQIEALERTLAALDAQIAEHLAPFRAEVERLLTIPGVGALTAAVLIAEIGVDMSRFPTAAHVVSWAGLCPRLDESAGKRRSRRIRKGGRWLKTTLVQGAWGAVRARDAGHLRARFGRLRARRGPKPAIVAVAAAILRAAYAVLRDAKPYCDLGADYFDRRDRNRTVRQLTRRLEALGYRVDIRPAA